jgi:Sulfotransferase family
MKKLFLLGCPRSGTTMLQQALNRHSRIAIPPETKFFFFLGASRRQQLRHVERLNADLGIRLPPPAAAVRSREEARTFYEALARLYVTQLAKPDVAYFGEKTPWHTGYLHRIRRVFPGAKILLLYRDGRDVAVSLSHMPWASPDLYVNFLVWLYYSRVVRAAKALAWPDVYLVRYEDLVAAPERELGGVLEFLGLPYEPAVAEGYGNREGIPEREYAWKARALQKITTERVGVFRRSLDADQIGILERLGGQALSSLGYPLLTDGRRPLPLGFRLSLAWRMSRFVFGLSWRSAVGELLNLSFWCRPDAQPPPESSEHEGAGEQLRLLPQAPE